MDFITGLSRTSRQNDSIMVVVNRMRKLAHLIALKSTNSTSEVAQIFNREIVSLHGVPKKIVLDRDAKFTSKFWKELFEILGIQLAFSKSYHPQTDGQTKKVNKILEDMLRMYVMHQQRKWQEYLPLVEFSYNNGYQESLNMSPFEALYGKSCNTPISWSDPVKRVLIGPYMLAEMELYMQVIRRNLKASQDQNKSYAYQHKASRSFGLGSMHICISSPIESL